MDFLLLLLSPLAWMQYLLRKLAETSLASFFWIPSCLIHLSYSPTSLSLSFPLHFSVLPLSRNIVSLLIASLLSSRCAPRGNSEGDCDRLWVSD